MERSSFETMPSLHLRQGNKREAILQLLTKRRSIGNGLFQLVIGHKVALVNLRMTSIEARRGFDHVIVTATLHGHGKADKKHRERDTKSGQQGTGFIPPEVSPSQCNHDLSAS